MMDVLSIASSGLAAAQAQLNVTANNIASLNTPGYKAQRVDLVNAPTGGVQVEGVESTGQSVEPASEFVKLKQAALMYGANAMMIRAAEHMYGSLLDIFDTDNQQNKSGQDNS
jgi:flagellar hook-associated protein FlgK